MNDPVFLDTVGILAVLNAGDQWHQEARLAWERLQAERAWPLTTSYVLAEAANAAARTPLRRQVILLRDEMEARGRLVFPTAADWLMAWTAYAKGEAGDAGLVDQLSFAVMKRASTRRAFTNDRHFRAAGFEVLF